MPNPKRHNHKIRGGKSESPYSYLHSKSQWPLNILAGYSMWVVFAAGRRTLTCHRLSTPGYGLVRPPKIPLMSNIIGKIRINVIIIQRQNKGRCPVHR